MKRKVEMNRYIVVDKIYEREDEVYLNVRIYIDESCTSPKSVF